MTGWRTALFLLLLAGPAAASDCVISMRLDEDPPYLIRRGDGSASGINADVAREAFGRMGCSVEFSRALITPEQIRRFDETVAGMRRDGTMAAILSSYGLDPAAAVDIVD